MKRYASNEIRNVCILAHSGAGKTSLGEAMLFLSGATTRLGSVDAGTSSLDWEPESQKRKTTYSSSVASVEWKKNKINLIDTPGDTNFFADIRSCASITDCSVILINAVDGVQVLTERAAQLASDFKKPTVIFINKMDKERANFEESVKSIKETFGQGAAAFQIPIGKEASFKGVISLLEQKAYLYPTDGSGKVSEADIPADLKGAASSARDALVEAIASTDDKLLEKFLETMELSPEEITTGVRKAIANRSLIPILCGAASSNMAVSKLMDFIVDSVPSPAELAPVQGTDPKTGETVERVPSADAPFSGQVFKTMIIEMGKVSLLRVFSGQLETGGGNIANSTRQDKERHGQVMFAVGKKLEAAPSAVAGDIVAIPKLRSAQTGDTLCSETAQVRFPVPELPNTIISFAVRPKSRGDEDKVASAIARVVEQDPSIRLSRDETSKEMLLSGLGQTHVEIAVERIKRYGADVELLPPKIPYKETIKAKVTNVEGKHKKQSGGRGQFGVCYIDIWPNPRGQGFEFENAIVGGAIPKEFIPAIEKGIRASLDRGIVAGYPCVDVHIRLFDGKYHDVDSDARSFEMAGSKGIKEAVKKAKPALLEPIMNMEITVPDEYMGAVMGDISQRRGRVSGSEGKGKNQVIKAQAPMAEVLKYAPDLRSLTQGRGAFTLEFSHYEEVPSHLADKIIAESKVADEEEE